MYSKKIQRLLSWPSLYYDDLLY